MSNKPTASAGSRPTASPRRGLPLSVSRATGASPAPPSAHVPAPTSRSAELRRAAAGWIADGRAQGWTAATLKDREHTLDRFMWWLENEEATTLTFDALTPNRIRLFLTYVREANPAGRFGSIRPSAKREARPATVHAYFRILRAFFNFLSEEGLLTTDPLKNVKAPRVPNDQIQPLSATQLQQLLDAARRSRAPHRNVAVIMVLVDTGMRVSELAALTVGDADRGTGELVVTGKGNKKRRIYMGVTARRTVWRYLEAERRDAHPDEPLFASVGGHQQGTALCHTGLHEIVAKAGKEAGIEDVRCSPHTLRHTFAINFLRGGGDLFELQQLMGHTDLTVLRRYVALAEADLAKAHRAASPADRLKLK